MALINCSECRKEISDKSQSCIGCGAPVAAAQTQSSRENLSKDPFAEYSQYIQKEAQARSGTMSFTEMADKATPGYNDRQLEKSKIDDKLKKPFLEKIKIYSGTALIFFAVFFVANLILFFVIKGQLGLDGRIGEAFVSYGIIGSAVAAAMGSLSVYDYTLNYVSERDALTRMIISLFAAYFIAYNLSQTDFFYNHLLDTGLMEIYSALTDLRNYEVRRLVEKISGGLIFYTNIIPVLVFWLIKSILLIKLKKTE